MLKDQYTDTAKDSYIEFRANATSTITLEDSEANEVKEFKYAYDSNTNKITVTSATIQMII